MHAQFAHIHVRIDINPDQNEKIYAEDYQSACE